MADDVLTRNDEGELAVRVVSATEQQTVVNPNDVYTRDTEGNLAVRVVGAGGGNEHFLGSFADQTALQTAYPTAEAGDFAIVESTDTVWVWDSDESRWVDSDRKGQVTSVNGQTGAVTVQETLVNQTNIKSVNGNSLLGSGNLELSTYLSYPAGWTTNSTTKAFCDDIAADSSAVVGKAYLGEVTLSDLPASMTNAEIVVEVMAGTTAATKVIVLTMTSGNTAPYRWQYTYWDNGTNVSGWKTWQEPLVSGTNIKTINGTSLLSSGDITTEEIQVSTMPTASVDELGNLYQFIGTTDANYTNGYFYKCVSDGQNPATYSWERTDVQPAGSSLPSQSGNAGKFLTTDGTDASWADALTNKSGSSTGVIVGSVNGASNYNRTAGLGHNVNCNGNDSTSVGYDVQSGQYSVAVGAASKAAGQNVVAVGYNTGNTSTVNKHSVYIGVGTVINSGGAGGVAIGYSAKPQNEGAIAIGKRTQSSGLYSIAIGGSPDYSGYNGAQATGGGSIAIGGGGSSGTYGANASGTDSIAIGHYAGASASHSIQIGSGNQTGATNSDANTVKIANINGNFEIMSADGTIPEARLADTTGATAGQALVLDSNLNAVWTNIDSLPSQTGNAGKFLKTDGTDASWGSVSSDTTGTVLASAWVLDSSDNKYKQTVNVTGVTATNSVFVSPFASDSTEWGNCGVMGAAQASGTITFWADVEPTSDLQFTATILA